MDKLLKLLESEKLKRKFLSHSDSQLVKIRNMYSVMAIEEDLTESVGYRLRTEYRAYIKNFNFDTGEYPMNITQYYQENKMWLV